MKDDILLPMIVGFAVLWVAVWLLEKGLLARKLWRERKDDAEVIECPDCGNITFQQFGSFHTVDLEQHYEYECTVCHKYATF